MVGFRQFLEGKEAVNAPKPLPYVLHNDPAKSYLDFEEMGKWFEEVFQYLPLDQIQFEAWNEGRFKDNFAKIKKTKKCPPIQTCFDPHINKYVLSDGNHRCAACEKLHYTHVPAIVTVERTTAPKHTPQVDAKRMERVGWELLHRIKSLKRVDWISVRSSTAKEFVGEIETSGKEDWKYLIKGNVVGGVYNVSLTGQGQNRQLSGTLDQVAKSVAGIILGIDDDV